MIVSKCILHLSYWKPLQVLVISYSVLWGGSLISLVRQLPRRRYTLISNPWGGSLISLVRQLPRRRQTLISNPWGGSLISLVRQLPRGKENPILNPEGFKNIVEKGKSINIYIAPYILMVNQFEGNFPQCDTHLQVFTNKYSTN